jgi:Holliday junction resolvase RusA-like endonuclease
MIQFFMAMEPPTTTAQMHQVTVRNGKPVFYDPPAVVQMKAKLAAHLCAHRPAEPLRGPLRLVCKWIWTGQTEAYKPTKPDTDNLQKALKDAMTKGGFWLDDCQVASEICEKMTGPQPGIWVRIEVLS